MSAANHRHIFSWIQKNFLNGGEKKKKDISYVTFRMLHECWTEQPARTSAQQTSKQGSARPES